MSEPAAPLPVAGLPPPNGFGSDEDSLSNCTHLIPKPPKKAVFSVADDVRSAAVQECSGWGWVCPRVPGWCVCALS